MISEVYRNTLRNKNINCHSYRVLLHDYDVKEFIGLLNSRTDFNFEELHVATHRRANESNVKASIASVKINEKIKRVEN